MIKENVKFVLFVVFVFILSHSILSAQESVSPTAITNSPQELTLVGKYDEAIKSYLEIIHKNPKDLQSCLELGEVYLETGKYDECVKACEIVIQNEPPRRDVGEVALVGLAEVYFKQGDYKKSDDILNKVLKANPQNLKARYLICELYMETGKYDDCEKSAEVFSKLSDEQINKLSSKELLDLAQGLWLYATCKGNKDIFHRVNGEILPRIEEIDKRNPALYTFWGFCYLDKDDTPEALDCFKDALKINPNYPYALLGMAYCGFAQSQGRPDGPASAQNIIQKALSVNPNFIEMINVSATIYLAEEKEEEALKEIDKALKINPNSLLLLATRASIYYLNNDLKEFESACQQILTINPKPALFYYILGQNCGSRMLYLDAQPFYQKAVELNPKFWEGYIALGLNGLKCGADGEEQARHLLEEAYKRDPFHPTVNNTLKVLDAIQDEFVVTKTKHITIKLNQSEAELLAPYITRLLEKNYQKFSSLLKFEPSQPLLCEVFPSMNDFSVRMTGLPGVDFALGVCFAKTFLVYSPEAQEKLRKRFHWGAVTTHEFMHIFTLQLSKFRVPRWFTEGCSVWSEKLANPRWSRELEMEIYQVYEAGKLQHMDQFTQKKGFDLIHTYLLSSIIIEYISQKYGVDKIIAMLKGFGERKKQEDVFKECLGKTLKEFDQEFFNYFENDWIKRIKIRKPPRLKDEAKLKEKLAKNAEDEEALSALARIAFVNDNLLEAHDLASKSLAVNPKNVEALITMGEVFYSPTRRRYETAIEYFTKALAAGADDFGTHFRLAISYVKTKKPDEAVKEFNEAKRCFPSFIKYEDNPYFYLAQIYAERSEVPPDGGNYKEKMIKELEAYVTIAHEDFTTQMKLAKIYREDNPDGSRDDELINLLEDTVYLEPKDLKLHSWLAEAHRRQKHYNEALREYQIEIFLLNQLEEGGKRDKWLSNFHCDMAEIYVEIGDKAKARQFAGISLKENPDNERTQKLLEDIGK